MQVLVWFIKLNGVKTKPFMKLLSKKDVYDPHNIYTRGRSTMTLNYWVIVERCPFPNGGDGGSIPALKSSLYLMEKLVK